MTEPAKPANFIQVERRLETPVLYFDAVPTAAWRNGVLSVVLALAVGELTSQSSTEQHLVAVADLRLTIATAIQLRAIIDKALLAATPTPGAAN
jgi:hypothetical protein